MTFVRDRNLVYRTGDMKEVDKFLRYHSISPPAVPDGTDMMVFWTPVYSAILAITCSVTELPWHEPDVYLNYSWQTMAWRADHVLRIWNVEPIPQLGRFRYRGVTYQLPRRMYCAVLDNQILSQSDTGGRVEPP